MINSEDIQLIPDDIPPRDFLQEMVDEIDRRFLETLNANAPVSPKPPRPRPPYPS